MDPNQKARDAHEMYELKHRAVKYYQENGVLDKMEGILNSMFYDNPDDVYGHLSNYFNEFSKTALVTKLKAKEVLDSRGLPTVQTDVFCTVRNHEKLLCSSVSSTESYPPDTAKPEDKDAAHTEHVNHVTKAIEYINDQMNTAFCKVDPTDQLFSDSILLDYFDKLQKEEDEKKDGDDLEDKPANSPHPSASGSPKAKGKSPKGKKAPAVLIIPDEPREKFLCGCNTISAVSQAICQSAATIKQVPLYQHIAQISHEDQLFKSQAPEKLHLPLPVVTILECGKLLPGKLNVKEFMVVPSPAMPVAESIKHISAIYHHCAKSISAKTGPVSRNTNDQGALCPTFDRVEQGLDLLQEAITHQQLTPGEHFNIILNCAGQEIFDYEKGKYEVIAGAQKLADDLADFWGDILNRYPSVIGLIDPMRKQEKEAWMKLCERLSEKCLVIGDTIHHRPGLLKDEELPDDLQTSGIVLRMEHMNSVADLVTVSKKMADANNEILFGASHGDTHDTFIVDLAVGLNARYLKIGAPCRGEKTSKLNRLANIADELVSQDLLEQWSDLTFPLLKAPTPPPPPEEGEGEHNESPEKK